jgi:uncharacterized phiE125 gp8 family phage protein
MKVITPPAEEPVTLDEFIQHSRIPGDVSELGLVQSYIETARIDVEERLRQALITQELRVVLDKWPSGRTLLLPRPPLISVESVTYVTSDGTEETLSVDDYSIDTNSEPGRIILNAGAVWPGSLRESGAIVIDYTAGYGARAAVPENYKQAIRLLAAHYYENREAVIVDRGAAAHVLPMAVTSLLNKSRVWRFG